MSKLKFLLTEQKEILTEISLEDHYEKFGDKFDISDFSYYKDIANMDSTSNDGKIKGKYTEWLLDKFQNMTVAEFEDYIEDNDIYMWLKNLSKVKGFDINKYKSLDELKDYYNNLDDEDLLSGKEKKKKAKQIFDSEDVKVIFENSEYIVAKPLTHKGSMMLARYKCPESAKWCTADPKSDSHWEHYTSGGKLYIVIPKDDPMEKFQFHVENGEVQEIRNFEDDSYDEGREILSSLGIEELVGVENFELVDLVITLDEKGAIGFYTDTITTEYLMELCNRPPTDEELEDIFSVSDSDIEIKYEEFNPLKYIQLLFQYVIEDNVLGDHIIDKLTQVYWEQVGELGVDVADMAIDQENENYLDMINNNMENEDLETDEEKLEYLDYDYNKDVGGEIIDTIDYLVQNSPYELTQRYWTMSSKAILELVKDYVDESIKPKTSWNSLI